MERDDRRVTPQRVVLGGHLNETGHRLPIHPGEFELMEPGGRRLVLVEGPGGKMGPLAERVFAFLTRNARNATLYFGVPAEQVVEVGMRIDL